MTNRGILISTMLATLVSQLSAQSVAPRPSFEVTSVKPSKATNDGSSWIDPPGRLVMKNQTLKMLVGIAYSVPYNRVQGGPSWSEADGFDVDAKASSPAKGPEIRTMLQGMLAERFQLVVHREPKAIAGFSLVVAKGGHKLHPDETGAKSGSKDGPGKIVVQRLSMNNLAQVLTRILKVPVIDATGLIDKYSFTLEWTPDTTSAGGADVPAGPSLYTVLPQELGLRLESTKVTADVVVIDKADKPNAN